MARVRTIALEEHFWTPELAAPPGTGPLAMWGQRVDDQLRDLGQGRLADMDANGIDLQVISHVPPAAQGLAGAEGIARAREANDRLAAAVRAHPDRFAGFATLPTADPRGRGRRARTGRIRSRPDRRPGQQHPRLERRLPRRRQVRPAARALRTARRAVVPASRAAVGGPARGAVPRAAAGRGGQAGHRRLGLARRSRPARAADDRHRGVRPASRAAYDRRALRRDGAVHAGPDRRHAPPGQASAASR